MRLVTVTAAALTLVAALVGSANAVYPPALTGAHPEPIEVDRGGPGLIFTNTHNYGVIEIKVELFNNYLGDFSKYHWVYTVDNFSFDPAPGITNGFSGFELALVQFVPDLGDLAAPDLAWIFNCCSGLPIEWDKTNSAGLGVMPGGTGVFSFTTLPRLITISEGWFHTWTTDIQTDIVNYPVGDGPESPDLQDTDPPDLELCCYINPAGNQVCEPRIVGECDFLGGQVVVDCEECFPVPTETRSWGEIKAKHKN